jgi:hypothetical protein
VPRWEKGEDISYLGFITIGKVSIGLVLILSILLSFIRSQRIHEFACVFYWVALPHTFEVGPRAEPFVRASELGIVIRDRKDHLGGALRREMKLENCSSRNPLFSLLATDISHSQSESFLPHGLLSLTSLFPLLLQFIIPL